MPDESRGGALRCSRLTVTYSGTPAIDGVDLAVGEGEVLAVLGASGSGKSTLLHAVAGLVAPSQGEIWLSGRRVASPARSMPPERRAVGLVFQDFALWPHLDALETVAFPLRRAGRDAREARLAARTLLERLDIGHLAQRRPAELSGGEQQRVGLARALARNPRLFLLDEPTAHLDTHLRAAFQECVRAQQAQSGAAAVYATHDATEALALADQVALIVSGRVQQTGAPHIVYAEPASVAAARLTGPCSVLVARVASGPPGSVYVDFGGAAVTVAGGGAHTTQLQRAHVLLRPDWVCLGGPLTGRVTATGFRGTHTDYDIDADVDSPDLHAPDDETTRGQVRLQLPGPPRLEPGDAVEWGITRAWVLPGERLPALTADQPGAAVGP